MEGKLKVDTGAQANLMPLKSYRKMFPEKIGKDGMTINGTVQISSATLSAYGGTVINQIGVVTLNCEHKGRMLLGPLF